MEIKATLQKPYTEEERMNFIVEYNHKLGYTIEEGVNEGGKEELTALGYTDEELQTQERERINMLSLTAADVERAIYKAKGMDFEDILKLVENNPDIDLKALKIELKANNFYRGNPYIEQVGALLGFTSEMLDEFFETNDYTYLLPSDQVEDVSDQVSEQVEVTNENTTDTDE